MHFTMSTNYMIGHYLSTQSKSRRNFIYAGIGQHKTTNNYMMIQFFKKVFMKLVINEKSLAIGVSRPPHPARFLRIA